MRYSIVTFAVLTVIANVVCYRFMNSRLVAAFSAACMVAISFQVVGYVVQGYLDPFFTVAFVMSWVVSFGLSLMIAFVLVLRGRRSS